MRLAIGVLVLFLGGCGDRLAYRPLTIDVQGLSSAADRLVLKAFPGSARGSCAGITLLNVQALETPFVSEWQRPAPIRELALPSIDEDVVIVVVYTEDAAANPIQLACSEVRYPEIETGRITLRLSARTALIIDGWRRSSVRSRSNGSSVVAGWRRCSSRSAAATPIAAS